MKTIRFEVYGQPATQGSKRAALIRRKGGAIVMKDGIPLTRVIDDNPKTAEWKQQVSSSARLVVGDDFQLLTGAVRLECVFWRPRPKGHFGTGRNANALKASAPEYPTAKPDTLKLARAVEDALTGVVWRDDSQVCEHKLNKRWGECFCVAVTITPLDQELAQ